MTSRLNARLVAFLEYSVLAIIGFFTISIAALDFLGILDSESWLIQRVPIFILLGVGSIASYLILERRNKLDAIVEDIERLDNDVFNGISRAIRSLDGVEILSFDDGSKFTDYFLSRVQTAKRMDDINWSESELIPTKKEMEDIARYREIVSEVASREDVIWREIVIFVSEHRFNRVKKHLDEGLPGYNAVVYDNPPVTTPQRIAFAIVDREEVFLAGQEHRIVIRHPDIVQYFLQYYTRLWERGKPLKKGSRIYMENLKPPNRKW